MPIKSQWLKTDYVGKISSSSYIWPKLTHAARQQSHAVSLRQLSFLLFHSEYQVIFSNLLYCLFQAVLMQIPNDICLCRLGTGSGDNTQRRSLGHIQCVLETNVESGKCAHRHKRSRSES